MTTREAWHEARLSAVCASEAAAVLGVSPYESALSVWARKRRLIDHDEATERMKWGTRLERPILAGYAEDEGVDVVYHDQSKLIFHPDFPRVPLAATPDGYEGDEFVMDAKNVDAWVAKEWDSGPPLHLVVQSQTQMVCAKYPRGKLVALFGGNRLQPFVVERNDAFIASMEATVAEWWARYVVTGEQPPADASESCIRTLERLHPDDNGREVKLGDEFVDVDARLAEVKAALSRLKEEKDELENRIKAAIGTNTFGVLPTGGRFSWKTIEKASHTVKAQKYRQLLRRKS